MTPHLCPWWGGYFIDNRVRRWLHNPDRILRPYVEVGMTVLDFGCGMGFLSIPLARLVGGEGQVIAVDLQRQMLEVLARRADKAGVRPRIRTHRCPAETLDLQAEVDLAVAFYSAHETPSSERLVAELHTLLRPGGKLLLVEPIGHVPEQQFRRMLTASESLGLELQERPRIRLSHAAVLQKRCAAHDNDGPMGQRGR